MKGEKKMRTITKFKRSIRAISPVISVLLMIAIAVVASLVAYAWVMGYMNFQTAKVGNAIQIPSYASQGGFLTVYVQNVGQGTLNIAADSSVYVNDQLRLVTASPSGTPVASNAKISLGEGNTVELVTDYPYTAGEKITIKIVTVEGTTMTVKGTTSSTGSGTITPVNNAPVAGFSYSANYLVVQFTDASSDSDGTVDSRSWAFGDGQTSTETSPSHTYAVAGTYDVVLTVTDNDGATDTETQSVTVTAQILIDYVDLEVVSGYTPIGSHDPNFAAMQGVADGVYDTLTEYDTNWRWDRTDYALDLRVSFTDVANFASYNRIGIQTGSLSTDEHVVVQYLSGSNWVDFDFNSGSGTRDYLDANQLNSAAISLSSSTLTIRFIDTDTLDNTLSLYQIDSVYLYVA
jgi:flagellin-like protein